MVEIRLCFVTDERPGCLERFKMVARNTFGVHLFKSYSNLWVFYSWFVSQQ